MWYPLLKDLMDYWETHSMLCVSLPIQTVQMQLECSPLLAVPALSEGTILNSQSTVLLCGGLKSKATFDERLILDKEITLQCTFKKS